MFIGLKHQPTLSSPSTHPSTLAFSPQSFDDIIRFAEQNRDAVLCAHLTHDVRLQSFKDGEIRIAFDTKKFANIPVQLRQFLKKHTHKDWIITVSTDMSNGETFVEKQNNRIAEKLDDAKKDPFIASLIKTFPKATLTLTEETPHARN